MKKNTEVKLKTIANISTENVRFYIDAYQRGYRWTTSEVKNLLDDIQEFSQTDYKSHVQGIPDKFYCLQPIIVTGAIDGVWKVIDGQQRMTTIYLIYLYYNSIAGKLMRAPLPFELHYNGKEKLEQCLADLKKAEYFEEQDLVDIKHKYSDDIDCYFILEAYGTICNYYGILGRKLQTQSRIMEMKAVFDSFMKIIWYELIDCSEQEEIEMFTKINMGKIPLTNSELIKALLLRSEGDKQTPYQDNIAIKWDEMESQLSESGFWSFLVNRNNLYSTKIDFLFEIMARHINDKFWEQEESLPLDEEKYYIEQAYNQQYFSFYVFNNYVRYLTKTKSEQNYVRVIWEEITQYYEMFKDWYNKRKWYHMIGYIVESSGDKYIDMIAKLSEAYKEHTTEQQKVGHKTLFEQTLRKIIIQTIKVSKPLTKTTLRDYIDDLEYGKDNAEIKRLLLLCNICSLELLEKETDARFPFDKYKSKDVSWDIEHINAVADQQPIDEYDRADGSNACKVWLENVLSAQYISELLMEDGKTKVVDEIQKILDKKLYLPQQDPTRDLYNRVYSRVIEYFSDNGDVNNNSVANLTLLDSKTNRSYHNSVFPVKRTVIITNCSKDVYIPLCTKEVFLKAYQKSSDLLRWTSADMGYYIDKMVERISVYLRLEEV